MYVPKIKKKTIASHVFIHSWQTFLIWKSYKVNCMFVFSFLFFDSLQNILYIGFLFFIWTNPFMKKIKYIYVCVCSRTNIPKKALNSDHVIWNTSTEIRINFWEGLYVSFEKEKQGCGSAVTPNIDPNPEEHEIGRVPTLPIHIWIDIVCSLKRSHRWRDQSLIIDKKLR